MTEHVPDPLPDPDPAVPESEKIPQSWVADLPEFQKRMARFEEQVASFRRWVLWGAIALGVAFAAIGVVALVSLHHSDQNTRQLDDKSADRDRIQAQTDNRLDRQAETIKAIQDKNQRAVCALVVGSVQQDKDNGKPTSPLTLQFAKDYGCVVPQALGGGKAPLRRP